MQPIRLTTVWVLFVGILLGIIPVFCGPLQPILAQADSEDSQASEVVEASETESTQDEIAVPLDAPARNYLFVHDTSKNMRKKKRIAMMQDTIRSVLSNLPQTSRAGLQAFGHRFSLDGPDFCTDSDILLPIEAINLNKEDIKTQLNLLSNPQLGGGAPVGLALRQGFEALKDFEEPKEIFFNLIDLQECPGDQSLAAIHDACNVNDLHLTLIGIGLKRDYQTLQEANVEQLGCVDVINITTPDEAEQLPTRLLTRLSLQFINAEGELIDPQPGERLNFTILRQDEDGAIEVVKEKFKDAGIKGSSLETVGLEEGNYLLDLEYQGQQLRSQKPITITAKQETREIFHLGKLLIEVTDFSGGQLDASLLEDLQVTLFDAGVPIRTVEQQNSAEFDLLPGNHYNVQVSYTLGGDVQTVEAESLIRIREGNHKNVSISLPIGALSGRIVEMNGQPAPRVEILLSTEDGQPVRTPRFTDKNGQYSFQDLPNGLYRLYLKKDGYKEDMRPVIVVGGRKNRIEDLSLFRGVEVQVNSISGGIIDDAEVTLIHQDSGERIPVNQRANIYRNVQEIQPGNYWVHVKRDGYEEASQEVNYTRTPPFVDVPFQLPYYVTISGHVMNAKQEGIPDAQLEFQAQDSSPVLPDGQETISTSAEGNFHAQLVVTRSASEQLRITWYDEYNQRYSKELEFSLPEGPQALDLGTISLPVNFLQLSLASILNKPINADSLLLTHQQSGQTGIRVQQLNKQGQYESLALVDGAYSLRVIKRGYQDVEHQFSIQGGDIHRASLTLHNYITITGTITDGKQNRVPNALVEIKEENCSLTTSQPIMTGKDGRFQTTLLVEKPANEEISISWQSPESGKEYRISREFELSGAPVEELKPHNLGNYEIPANFIRVEVQDVFGHGLPGVDVQFISRRGDRTAAIELGNGTYESLDLYDGYYNIALGKNGYKENIIIPDIAVGKNKRDLDAGPVQLPHYATVIGTVFNGEYTGMPNVELFFGNKASEQLESCRTDQHGKFSTTLLVTGPGKEHWRAIWEEDENFSSSGIFTLPVRPRDIMNIGEIRLPVNFVSIPVQDIRGKMLSEVTLFVSAQGEQQETQSQRFSIEELEPGLYQIQNLPDGRYRVTFEKAGYELGKTVDIDLKGGENLQQAPVQLGYYVTVVGKTINGRAEAVPNANVHFKALHSTLQQSADQEEEEEKGEEEDEPSSYDIIQTDQKGRFTARLLVTSPGIEELESDWAGKFGSLFQLDVSQGPGIQHITLKLPINFITVTIGDIAGKSLSDARVTLEPQSGDQLYLLEEQVPGLYQSDGIPDGSYDVRVSKQQYESRSTLLSVQTGENRQADFILNHYVTVKGQILDGKREGISAAVIAFANLKTDTNEKIFSGTDGVFETSVLVKELGRESGTISWDGKNGSYSIPFLIELPTGPGEIILPKEQTVLPINYVAIEVKSVAATGIAGATVRLVNQADTRAIDARDNKNGNYSGEEIPDGIYDISITKDKYQSVTVQDVHLEGGVYKSDISIPRFSHYITLSGLVVNGKRQGVPDAIVSITEPKSLQEVTPFTTRDDGSFTLHALVTDVSSETLEVVWNDSYRTSLPLKIPLLPEDVQLKDIRLPINFISLNVQDIYGQAISGADVSFAKKHSGMPAANPLHVDDLSGLDTSSSLFFAGNEIADGLYESPELPDNDYLIVVTKEGYIQKNYPELSVAAGVNVSAKPLSLPHTISIKGRVIDGKGEGVPGTVITIAENNSERSLSYLESDESGYFSERLQITGRDTERLSLLKEGSVAQQEKRFSLSQNFTPLKKPGEQDFGNLRLPINFIPIQVHDVAGQAINDATIRVRPANASPRMLELEGALQAVHLGDGKYEARNLNDGSYIVSVQKEGYETQEASTTVSAGEVVSEIPFVLPHYVLVKGIVTTGKGDGLPDAVLEFTQENSQLLPVPASQSSQEQKSTITTDIDGQFTAQLLVTQSGQQHVQAGWNGLYVTSFSFPLPDKPAPDYRLDTEIRLPINFAPFRISNILGQGLAGVDITLQQMDAPSSEPLLAYPLGDGYYEARELQDGRYMMTVHKDGYQEITGDFSIEGGEQAPEQHFTLPHYVSIVGKVVNGKGQGIQAATVRLQGKNSKLLQTNDTLKTGADGSFQLDVLVGDSETNALDEHLEISWSGNKTKDSLTFAASHDFMLPAEPRVINLGALSLPANFFPVEVKDVSGRSLSNATVIFSDDDGTQFPAKELSDGSYEGQNLPDGIYTVHVSKKNYKADQSKSFRLGRFSEESPSDAIQNLSFKLPYYVDIRGTCTDGKGQTLGSGMTLDLKGLNSELLPNSINFDQKGSFEARLLVQRRGSEELHLSWQGEHGVHARDISFMLPDAPQRVDFQRLSLPVNFIPVEVKDLQGYGLSDASVTLYHIESESTTNAIDLGDGQYEGQNLPDGSYEISVTKDGYKASEHILIAVADGVVSEKRSFLLRHYVNIIGIATNGNGEGVSDPVIEVEKQRSDVSHVSSGVSGEFELRLEVKEVGNERIYLDWKHKYRLPLIFKLPEKPGTKDLGEIRLPINFLSIFARDVSGSTLPEATVLVEEPETGFSQLLKTDKNGFCRTDELPNGHYDISVSKKGYQSASRKHQLYNGRNATLRFTLPHYVLVKGKVTDIMHKAVGNADIVFEEFFDENYQKIRTLTDPESGRFEQQLLIDDPAFLERQKGHFYISQNSLRQEFTFKIPPQPEQVLHYKTLLFPIKYLTGKVVDTDIQTVPITEARVLLTPINGPLSGVPRTHDKTPDSEILSEITTNSLGEFTISHLAPGEYKIRIQKDGYLTYEDFIRISSLLQEQEFALRKAE